MQFSAKASNSCSADKKRIYDRLLMEHNSSCEGPINDEKSTSVSFLSLDALSLCKTIFWSFISCVSKIDMPGVFGEILLFCSCYLSRIPIKINHVTLKFSPLGRACALDTEERQSIASCPLVKCAVKANWRIIKKRYFLKVTKQEKIILLYYKYWLLYIVWHY